MVRKGKRTQSIITKIFQTNRQQAIAQGKIKQPKIDKQQGIEIIRQLAKIGGNINQIAKWCNTHKETVTPETAERFAHNLEQIRKELQTLWQQLK